MRSYTQDVQWRFNGKKRPFAQSTRATSDLINTLYEMYGDRQKVYDNIHYDKEAKEIVAKILSRL